MFSEKRKSGIPLIGELPWGSHLCQFYQTTEELLDILVPYFQAGLENNEYCLWVTTAAPDDKTSVSVLEEALRHFETFTAKGQMEIVPFNRWNADYGKARSAVFAMLDRAFNAGYDGLRIGCTAGGTHLFAREIEDISRCNAVALFAYPRDEFDTLRLMEVIKRHRFALIRNAGRWEVMESSEALVVKDELIRNEEKLKSLFSNMSEGFAYHRIVLNEEGRPCDYVFLEVNAAFEKLTGLKGADIIGKRVTEVLPGIEKDPTDWIAKYGDVALTGRPVQFESQSEFLRRWYSVSAFSPYRGFFAVTFSDITDRKRTEEEIAELNEALKKNVAELSSSNASMRESRIAALNIMEDAIAARRQAEEANRELSHEVAERKQTEDALRKSLRRFELLTMTVSELLQSAEPQGVVESVCHKVMEYLDCHAFFNFLVDEKAGRLHLNAFAGIAEEEAKKIEWLDFGVAVCGCAARDAARIVAEHIPATTDERTVLIRSYGITAYCCHPLLGPGGKVIGTLSFGTRSRETFSPEDLSLMKAVTDQVAVAMIRMKGEEDVLRLSEDMAARNVELEEVNRELEAFIYSVSHDLRAPLRSMAGFARILLEDSAGRLDEKEKDYLSRIYSGSARMSQLIEDLLNLSRISRQEIKHSQIDMSKLAFSAISDLREAYPRRDVDVFIGEGFTAFADRALMEVVLSNLLGNAWKFTSKKENARIEFGRTEQEGKTVFFVRDNGAGFDPAYAEKMFWPFQRLHSDDEFEGTGIGLAIAERIIRRHGGRIWAEGEEGKGAVVYFTLG